jgi:glycosyltransferase involved in cell wall biosynthesis
MLPHWPEMASYRLRVEIPRKHLGLKSKLAEPGDVCFFYKHPLDLLEVAQVQRRKGRRIVYDVVNNWFDLDRLKHIYHGMCALADVVTCGSAAMARIIKDKTGRDAIVVEEPYENRVAEPHTSGRKVLWFGQRSNLANLPAVCEELRGLDFPLLVMSDVDDDKRVQRWTPEGEAAALAKADIVLLSGVNAGASANRLVKAVRAGCYVVATDVESYREFADWVSVGDVRGGMEWALSNPDECRRRVLLAQAHIENRFAPQRIGEAWKRVFLTTASS